jgi:hypothetical protein
VYNQLSLGAVEVSRCLVERSEWMWTHIVRLGWVHVSVVVVVVTVGRLW